jgi:anthranilate/para-aminobenzoate synthase component I
MKSFVSLPFKIDWRDIANKIEPNDLTIYLRDDNNFTIGWDFEDIFTLNNELSLQGIDRYVKKHNGDFIFFNLGYNLKNLLEPKLRSKNPVFINFPDAELKCPSNLIQSINGSLYYFGNLSVKNITGFLKKKYNRCKSVSASVNLEQIESKEEYISKIEKIKSQIQRGDI